MFDFKLLIHHFPDLFQMDLLVPTLIEGAIIYPRNVDSTRRDATVHFWIVTNTPRDSFVWEKVFIEVTLAFSIKE